MKDTLAWNLRHVESMRYAGLLELSIVFNSSGDGHTTSGCFCLAFGVCDAGTIGVTVA